MRLQLWSCVDGEPEDVLAEVDVTAAQWAAANSDPVAAHEILQELRDNIQ